MSFSSPTSVITAMPTFDNVFVAINWASRSSAQSLFGRLVFDLLNGASCTHRNGKSPCFQCARQSWIMVVNSVRYSYAWPAFDSP